jgi:hypothetical protein
MVFLQNLLQLNLLFFLTNSHSSGVKSLLHFSISSILFGIGLFRVSGTYKQMNPQTMLIIPYITEGSQGTILVY